MEGTYFCGIELETHDAGYFYSAEANTILQEVCVDSASVLEVRAMISF